MAKVDVAIIGAGAAGLTAAALLAKEGKSVVVLEASEDLGGRGMAVPDEGFKLNLGGHLLEDSGSGITKVFAHVGKELVHGARLTTCPSGTTRSSVGLDPRPLRGQQGRAQEGHPGADGHAVRGARRLGRPPAARVDAPAHARPGRDRPVGVPLGAGVHDRAVVRPLGLREPLRAQDALLRGPHRGLLVLARAGLGRHVRGPARRGRRARGRGAPRHARGLRADRGGRGQGRLPRARQGDPERVPRGRGARGRRGDLDAAGLERAARGARVGAAGLVRGQIRFLAQDHLRISWLGLYLATKEPVHAIDARELADLAAHAQGARERLHVQHDRDGPEHLAARDQPVRRGRDHRRVQGQGRRLPDEDVRALRGRPEDDVPGAEARPTGAAGTSSTTRRSA